MSVDRAQMRVVIGQNSKRGFEGVWGVVWGGRVVLVVMIKLGISYPAFCFRRK